MGLFNSYRNIFPYISSLIKLKSFNNKLRNEEFTDIVRCKVSFPFRFLLWRRVWNQREIILIQLYFSINSFDWVVVKLHRLEFEVVSQYLHFQPRFHQNLKNQASFSTHRGIIPSDKKGGGGGEEERKK